MVEIHLTVELNPEQLVMITDLYTKMSKQIAHLKGRVRKLEGEVTL